MIASAGRGGLSPTTTALRTEAWLLRGISSIPGELILAHGVIQFVANGSGSAWPWQLRRLEHELAVPGLATSIDRGVGSCAFRWPLEAVDAWVPFHYFGGGIRLRHKDIVLSFSFGRPANMDLRVHAGPGDALAEVRSHCLTVRRMREHGRRWLAVLANKTQ